VQTGAEIAAARAGAHKQNPHVLLRSVIALKLDARLVLRHRLLVSITALRGAFQWRHRQAERRYAGCRGNRRGRPRLWKTDER
jgi:hypothetical protein